MKDAVTITYTVTVEIDPEVWSLNYGTEGQDTALDIKETLPESIRETINEWINRTGNSGYARVAGK